MCKTYFRFRLHSYLSVLVFTSLSVVGASSVQGAWFSGLGDLPGGEFSSEASSVSADGTVVAGAGTSASGHEAFRWTAATGMVGLGDFPGGDHDSYAHDVSADGSVVVGYGTTDVEIAAFRWTEQTGMVDLEPGDRAKAVGVSADGSVIAGRWPSSPLGKEAYRWTEQTGIVGLGDLPGGAFNSRARNISADGLVIVGRAESALGKEAAIWTQSAGLISLGDLPGGTVNAIAEDVSADGAVVVGFGQTSSKQAFIWRQETGMVNLGDLPGGAEQSAAFGVTADGSVVVGYGSIQGGQKAAFIWDETNGMRSLQDVLVNEYGLALDGWLLSSAESISGNGLFIVGYGINPDGLQEAWIASLDTTPQRMTSCNAPPAAPDRGAGFFRKMNVADLGLKARHFNEGAGGVQLPWPFYPTRNFGGGIAAGDYDNDGWEDLYVLRGKKHGYLFRNLGGTFENVTTTAGLLDIDPDLGAFGAGATFVDYDGDGDLDLFLGAFETALPRMLKNRGDGTFEEATGESGLFIDRLTLSAAFGDYDLDGDLDAFLTHWQDLEKPERDANPLFLWQNQGDGTFSDASAQLPSDINDNFLSFTPNFADINGDGWPDLLVTGDEGTSKVLVNQAGGAFTDSTDPLVITDTRGAGGAVGDYDNDGDLDWFVTSVEKQLPEQDDSWTGNRLYQNQGDGSFVDVTDVAGVRSGYWGWGSCFADFNNDGHLDIFHLNGWQEFEGFEDDPSRLFISNGDGTFTERSSEFGIQDLMDGRGLVCFDYDRDGDTDIFTWNNNQRFDLYRNQRGNDRNYFTVRLNGPGKNTQAVGARIELTANGKTQHRVLRVGSNFASQNPLEVQFGLGGAQQVQQLRIEWPDNSSGAGGTVDVFTDLSANQCVKVSHPDNP